MSLQATVFVNTVNGRRYKVFSYMAKGVPRRWECKELDSNRCHVIRESGEHSFNNLVVEQDCGKFKKDMKLTMCI